MSGLASARAGMPWASPCLTRPARSAAGAKDRLSQAGSAAPADAARSFMRSRSATARSISAGKRTASKFTLVRVLNTAS